MKSNFDIQAFGKVAVLMGGWSSEREISLVSGAAVLKSLQDSGVDAYGIDVDRQIDQTLRAGGYDRVFNVLHGRGGEDGEIQGLLEILGLPYTGSGVKASALSMDKTLTKRIWQSAGIPTPHFICTNELPDPQELIASLGLPLIIKPNQDGSSVGLSKVASIEEIPAAFAAARSAGSEVLIEACIEGTEYSVPIVNGKALPSIRVEPASGLYDFEAKYQADDTAYFCPSGITEVFESEMGAICLRAFEMLGARGWGRIDLIVDADGQMQLLELNTVPGMTSHSLVPKSAATVGMDFDELVLTLLAMTL